ncbi:MAG: hypothetical protein IJB45_06400 [Clostridia bacterium]|nr:hypothetical protein [Clostridia bacterium]
MNIPMPSEAEKQKSIEYIKENGLVKNENLFSVIKNVYRNLGIKNIFFGVGDCIFLALICVLAALGISSKMELEYLNCTVLVTAPMFFVIAHLLTSWKDYMSGTNEQKAVCKYKPVHITAFRMLTFSLVSIACDVPASLVLSSLFKGDFLSILLFSFCSLFLYSFVMTLSLLVVRWRFIEYAVPVVWVAVNLIPTLSLQKWAAFLNSMNSALPFIFCILLAGLYIAALDLLVKKGERKNAYR